MIRFRAHGILCAMLTSLFWGLMLWDFGCSVSGLDPSESSWPFRV